MKTEILLPGFTSFVPTRKIKSTNSYQTSSNKYLSDSASSVILPMQGTLCRLEADIETSWNHSFPPPDEECKWRKIRGRSGCECWRKHWRYAGQLTKQQCAGFGRIAGDSRLGEAANAQTGMCWQRDRVDCPDEMCESEPTPACPDCESCDYESGFMTCYRWNESLGRCQAYLKQCVWT